MSILNKFYLGTILAIISLSYQHWIIGPISFIAGWLLGDCIWAWLIKPMLRKKYGD